MQLGGELGCGEGDGLFASHAGVDQFGQPIRPAGELIVERVLGEYLVLSLRTPGDRLWSESGQQLELMGKHLPAGVDPSMAMMELVLDRQGEGHVPGDRPQQVVEAVVALDLLQPTFREHELETIPYEGALGRTIQGRDERRSHPQGGGDGACRREVLLVPPPGSTPVGDGCVSDWSRHVIGPPGHRSFTILLSETCSVRSGSGHRPLASGVGFWQDQDMSPDPIPTVSFTRMSDGTADDYRLLAEQEAADLAGFPDRVLGWLRSMDEPTGYRVTRFEHSLQAATRALRAGEDEEMIVCALLHDVGDVLAPANHSEVAAAMLRPYVSDRSYWIIKHHGVFQEVYYAHHYGRDPNGRDRYRDHPWFQATADFCADYDQVSFDPDYDTEPLEIFEPMVRRVLSTARSHV